MELTRTQNKWITAGELGVLCVVVALGCTFSVVVPLLVIASLSLWLRKSGWTEVGLDIDDDTLMLALIGGLLGVVAQVLNIWLVSPELEGLSGRAVELNHVPALRGNSAVLINALLLTWAMVVATEMVFRGFVLNRVAELVDDKGVAHGVGVVVSAGLFAWAVGGGRMAGVVGAFIAGVGYGYLYLAGKRRLVLPIAFAGAFETVNLIAIYLKLVD